MHKFFCVLIALVLTSAAAPAATPAEWRRDLQLMVERLRAHHPAPWNEVGERAFMREAERIERSLELLDEPQRAVAVMRLFASLRDQGTAVDLDRADWGRWYPVRLHEFTDGWFLTSVHDSVRDLAGARVIAINDVAASAALSRIKELQPSASAGQARERMFAFHNATLMQGLGLARPDGSLPLTVELANGRRTTRVLQPQATNSPFFRASDSSWAWTDLTEVYGTPIDGFDRWIAFSGLPAAAYREPDAQRPLHLQRRRAFHTHHDAAHDTYYAQVNVVSDARDESFLAFFARVLEEARQLRPRRIVLDFRLNGGGDGSKALPAARQFVRLGDEPPWRELYVLVGRRTAGSALAVVTEIAKHVPVTIVGEPGGSPNLSTEAQTFAYPVTGLRQHVATRQASLLEGSPRATHLPLDVPVAYAFADYRAGRDPALDPIRRGDEMRSLRAIAFADGGRAARDALAARRRTHAAVEGWSEPTFDTVKRLGYDLVGAQRAADAIDVFTLMTELYPYHWNSWESLGVAQAAAGDAVAARQSNRCALKLDPENWDAPGLRASLAAAPAAEPAALPAACPR